METAFPKRRFLGIFINFTVRTFQVSQIKSSLNQGKHSIRMFYISVFSPNFWRKRERMCRTVMLLDESLLLGPKTENDIVW